MPESVELKVAVPLDTEIVGTFAPLLERVIPLPVIIQLLEGVVSPKYIVPLVTGEPTVIVESAVRLSWEKSATASTALGAAPPPQLEPVPHVPEALPPESVVQVNEAAQLWAAGISSAVETMRDARIRRDLMRDIGDFMGVLA